MMIAKLPRLLLLLSWHLACQAQTPPSPRWYPQFSVVFNETTRIFAKRETTGVWWYDWGNKAEVVDRADGNGDRYCGSIHPFSHTPCRHVVVGGFRYLLFPELDECCRCCSDAQGCGVLSPTWLDDAEFGGTEELRGRQVYKWSKGGLQTNVWLATADEQQLPVELDQVPNDLQSFEPSSFVQRPIEPDLVTIPANCHTRCPISSVCSLLAHSRTAGPSLQPKPLSTAAV